MKYNVYFLQYNNYYNRQLKKMATIADYEPYTIAVAEDRNLDIKDDLKTVITINYAEDIATPNYLLIEDRNASVETFTRWFVIECIQTRGLQYTLQIKRDVLAEYFDTIKRSPCLLYKGYVGNDNVLVFNKEQQEYNKIKKKEILLDGDMDHGVLDPACIIGFIGKDVAGGTSDSDRIEVDMSNSLIEDFDYNSLPTSIKNLMSIGNDTPTSYAEDKILKNVQILPFGQEFTFDYRNGVRYVQHHGIIVLYENIEGYTNVSITTSSNLPNSSILYTAELSSGYPNVPTESYASQYIVAPFCRGIKNIMQSKLNNQNVNYREVLDVNESLINALETTYNNKICKINGVYYRTEFVSEDNGTGYMTNDKTSFTNKVRNSLPTTSDLMGITPYYNQTILSNTIQNNSDIIIYYNKKKCHIKLTPAYNTLFTYITSKNLRSHLTDAPYDMFVIPYSLTGYSVNSTWYQTNPSIAFGIAQAICEKSGSAVYDIQLVPYCPLSSSFGRDLSLLNKQAIYKSNGDSNYNNDEIIGYYFWADKSSFTRNKFQYSTDLTLTGDVSYKKISQLKKYILCSPDKNQQWEFNPAMNHGIEKWIITCDYKPFSSYIKIQPEFKDWLYGPSKFNDKYDFRGLVINAGYSLTQLNDQWAEYLNQNKNYQQIFDTQINTQIKTYDVQNKAAWDTMIQRSANASLGGGLYEIANLLSFGHLGSKADAVRKEQEMTEQIQGLTLAQSRDLFNYQLDNIKNQPDTLKKITSITSDFKIYPFIEIYECTEQEEMIFDDMIKYNGMTLMVTGYIENYLKPNDETFIQGTLIRFNEFEKQENDFTLVQMINSELNQGVYITKED